MVCVESPGDMGGRLERGGERDDQADGSLAACRQRRISVSCGSAACARVHFPNALNAKSCVSCQEFLEDWEGAKWKGGRRLAC